MVPGHLSHPLLTSRECEALNAARRAGASELDCSLDLGISRTTVAIEKDAWTWQQRRYPYPERCKDRTIYFWNGASFEPVSRFGTSLVKLVPTDWGPPTFEIDGIKMLPTAAISPYEDARCKVELIRPRGKAVLDTCAGLGYFAAWCARGGARLVLSCERNPDVLWLRSLNPWSPQASDALSLVQGDIVQIIREQPDAAFDAILHDPPRFGIAGELYSQAFYEQLARVLKRRGTLFHYTGTPNKLTTGRDVPREVARRLVNSGFSARLYGDGVLATRQ